MIKSKLPTACLNVLKAAVLCGVSLQPLQPAFAGWNKDIFNASALEKDDLMGLKQRCVEKRKTASNKIKWNQRGENIRDLLPQAGALTLSEKKGFLLDKGVYNVQLSTIDPTASQVKPNITNSQNKTGDLRIGTIDIPEEKGISAVSIISKEVTVEDLQGYISVLELTEMDEKDKTWQLNNLRAQLNSLQRPDVEKKNASKSTTINSTPKLNMPELKDRNVASVIENEMTAEEIQGLITVLELTEMDEKDKTWQLNNLRAQLNSLQRSDVEKKNASKSTTINSTPKLSPIAQEITELNLYLASLGESVEDKRSKSMIQAKLEKLERAHADGVPSYGTEQELDYYMVPITSFTGSLAGPTQHTFSVLEQITDLQTNVIPLLNEFGSVADKEAAGVRLQKLQSALEQGIETYTREEDL